MARASALEALAFADVDLGIESSATRDEGDGSEGNDSRRGTLDARSVDASGGRFGRCEDREDAREEVGARVCALERPAASGRASVIGGGRAQVETARARGTGGGAAAYSAENVVALRESLARWLRGLGLISAGDLARGLEGLFESFTDGVVLCALAERLRGARVTGVFRSPRTVETRRANVRKAVDAFLGMKNMSRRCLTGETFGAMDICGMMEDARALADGLPPRPRPPWVANKPYAPDVPGLEAPIFDRGKAKKASNRDVGDGAATRPRPRPWDSRAWPKAETNVIEPKIVSKPSRPFEGRTNVPLPVASKDTTECSRAIEPEEALDHVRWLTRLKIWPEAAPNRDDAVARFTFVFRLGVVLCDVIERIYHQPLPGVARDPPAGGAAALHNVSVALRRLRADARVRPTYLWSERDVARGDPRACSGLLRDVRERARGIAL